MTRGKIGQDYLKEISGKIKLWIYLKLYFKNNLYFVIYINHTKL